jgi:hypothetical protein
MSILSDFSFISINPARLLHFCSKQLVDLVGGIFLQTWNNMRAAVQGHVNSTMTQLFLHDFGMTSNHH